MIQELRACLEANGLLGKATHEVATQEDVLILVKAGLGVAIVPVAGVEAHGVCHMPLKQLNLTRTVSVHTVAGRQRAIACGTLFNMLRAADWGLNAGMKQQRRACR
jgi:hypothetical protein